MTITELPTPARRRLAHDPIEPPPDEAHGPGRCLDCAAVITMHSSGRCSRCGDWLTRIDAAEARSGDLILIGTWWATVVGTSLDVDEVVRIAVDADHPTITVAADSTVWVATNQRTAIVVMQPPAEDTSPNVEAVDPDVIQPGDLIEVTDGRGDRRVRRVTWTSRHGDWVSLQVDGLGHRIFNLRTDTVTRYPVTVTEAVS